MGMSGTSTGHQVPGSEHAMGSILMLSGETHEHLCGPGIPYKTITKTVQQ